MGANAYYKKPEEIEAILYNGENITEVADFVKESLLNTVTDVRFVQTVMGVELLTPNTYIVKDKHGLLSLMLPEQFEKLYALVQ